MAQFKCSKCGETIIGGSDGVWICPHCGNEIDRSVSGRAAEGLGGLIGGIIKVFVLALLLPIIGIIRLIKEFKNGNKKIGIFFLIATIIAWTGLVLLFLGSEAALPVLIGIVIIVMITDSIFKKKYGSA